MYYLFRSGNLSTKYARPSEGRLKDRKMAKRSNKNEG